MRLNWYRATALFMAILSAAFIASVITSLVHAAEVCPTAEPCKVIVLSASEEKVLMQQNGVLDTAAQARNLDLGQFVVYLKTRIAAAPAGESPKTPAPVENKPATPVDSTPK